MVSLLTENIMHIFSFYTCKVVTFILLEVISYDINFNNEIRTWQIWISSIWIFTKPNLNCKKFWFLKWSFMKIGQKTFAGPLHLITFFGRFGLSWFFFVIKWSRRNKFFVRAIFSYVTCRPIFNTYLLHYSDFYHNRCKKC